MQSYNTPRDISIKFLSLLHDYQGEGVRPVPLNSEDSPSVHHLAPQIGITPVMWAPYAQPLQT